MPRAVLTEEQVADFRRRATAAATVLFSEQGYEAVTMRGVARALGCSAMTPYRYVSNKEELFAMVRADAYRRFADAQEAAFETEGPVLARIARLREAYLSFALEEPNAYRVMFELQQPDPGDHPELLEQSERAFSYNLRLATEAQETGVLEGDPLTLAHLFWAGIHGLISLHLAGKLRLGRSIEQLVAFPIAWPTSNPDPRRTP